MTIREFFSTAFTSTEIEKWYMPHSQVTCLPGSSLPLPLVNQNWVVMSGLTNASKTSATGLRMSIAACATGGCLSAITVVDLLFFRCCPFQFLNVELHHVDHRFHDALRFRRALAAH